MKDLLFKIHQIDTILRFIRNILLTLKITARKRRLATHMKFTLKEEGAVECK